MELYSVMSNRPLGKGIVELLETGGRAAVREWRFSDVASRKPGLHTWYSRDGECRPCHGATFIDSRIVAVRHPEAMVGRGRTFILDEENRLYYAVDTPARTLRRRRLTPDEHGIIFSDLDKLIADECLYCGSVNDMLVEFRNAGYGEVKERRVSGKGYVPDPARNP